MTETGSTLRRMLAALARDRRSTRAGWADARAYIWNGRATRPVASIDAPRLDLLRGIAEQKRAVSENVARLAAGQAAHDMLLWGARGMGKSALVRSAVASAQEADWRRIALVQVGTDALATLPDLFVALAGVDRNFLVFIDDLGFATGDAHGPRHLRSWLDGGVEARPGNVRLAVTSNRRAILARSADDRAEPLNPRDDADDALALSDRFGLSLGFHACSQDEYLAMVAGYAEEHGLEWDAHDALEWSRRRGARSGRVAWHYVTELAGRAGTSV